MFDPECIIRDLALIEVMRKCKFIVDDGALSVYSVNTYQDSIMGPAEYRSSECCKACDDFPRIKKLYEPYVKKYLLDAWKSCLIRIQNRNYGDGFCKSTPSFAAALQGIPNNSIQFAKSKMLAEMISGLASSLISSHEEAEACWRHRPRTSVTIPMSEVWKIYELQYTFMESIKFWDADEQTIINNIDTLCNIMLLSVYVNSSMNTFDVSNIVKWTSHLTHTERCNSPEYRYLVNKAVKYSTFSPDAIVAMDLDSLKSKNEWRDYYARSYKQVPEDTPEFRYLLIHLRLIEKKKMKKSEECGEVGCCREA